MARAFNGSTQYLDRASAVVTATPLTMACWYKPYTLGVDQTLMCIGRQADYDEVYRLIQSSGNYIQARVEYTGTGIATVTAPSTLNVWQHACAVFTSATSRAAYRNGTSKGTDTTSAVSTSLVRTSLGRTWTHYNGYHYWSGEIAFPCIWNAALTDDEVAMLARGVWPPLIRPDKLVAFWPLMGASPEPDIVGGYGMTPYNGPTVTDNPRIFMPHRRQVAYSLPLTVYPVWARRRPGIWTPGRT